jgi:alkanesulfonate monooxygenase SsuD/methylene tetrahydromethanopterin reductase-like flavin-dependent oxidoreductase (luciferase family)
MVGVNVFAADTDAGARRLFTSLQRQFINLRRGVPGLLQPPDDALEENSSEMEQAGVGRMLACSVVGSAETVRRGLESFISRTQADEIMVTAQIFDHVARLRSYEIVAGVMTGRKTT